MAETAFGGRGGRKVDMKGRTLSEGTVEGDGAAQTLDDSLDDAEPETGAALAARVRAVEDRKSVV